MFNLLERAGLVSRVEDGPSEEPEVELAREPRQAAPSAEADAALPVDRPAGMSLDQIYEAAGVPPCPYPAERLLRLIDGLKAMDAPTRRQTIHALDAADDTWSLDDPKRDAAAKVAAIERHAASIRAAVARDQQETQTGLQDVAQRQETTLAEIRRQITELEGLLAREIARGAQETAELESAHQSQRDSANRELAQLMQTAQTLTGLIAQFETTQTK
ncbi:MAG: methyl-accepting chemotaxis protein [Burkholderiaceae bacterium]